MTDESSDTQSHKENKIITYTNNKELNSLGDTQSPDELDFTRFWQVYPKHVQKKTARYAFFKACKTADKYDIISGALAFADAMKSNNTLKKYIPHASTWLNGERWEDDFDDLKEETNTQILDNILSFPLNQLTAQDK